MKKIVSLALAVIMLLSVCPMVYAADVDYTQGTQVVYEATSSEAYTITVPALLAPGGSGTVTLSGTWADNRTITVTADPSVTLTNSIKAEDQKVLTVYFDGISEAGSNTGSQTFTETVSVDNITNALFGTWSGKFNYNVELNTDEQFIYYFPDAGEAEAVIMSNHGNRITFAVQDKFFEYVAEYGSKDEIIENYQYFEVTGTYYVDDSDSGTPITGITKHIDELSLTFDYMGDGYYYLEMGPFSISIIISKS